MSQTKTRAEASGASSPPENAQTAQRETAQRETAPRKRLPRRTISPNLRLDPHGFSGTPTAKRIKKARRRRQLQSLYFSGAAMLVVVLAATLIGAQLLGFSSPVSPLKTQVVAPVEFSAFGPATLGENGEIWVGARNAALWKIGENGQSQRFWSGDFPASIAPLSFAVGQKPRVAWGTLDGTVRIFDANANSANVNANSATEGAAPIWSKNLGAPISTRLLHAKNTLFCATDAGKVAAFDAQSGAARWGTELRAPVGEALAATTNGVLVPTLSGGLWRGGLVHLSQSTGAILWRFPAQNTAHAAGVCAPFFDPKTNRVFWANDEGAVFALNAQNGQKIWKTFAVALDAKTVSPAKPVVLRGAPVLLDETVFVGGNDGILRAFDAKNGELQWSANLGAPITAPVQSAGDLAIWARTQNGAAFVLGRASGEVLRRAQVSDSAVWNGDLGFDFSARGELLKLQIS